MEKDTKAIEPVKKDNQLYEAVSSVVKDDKGLYLYKRADKISKAFFLLTQHIEDAHSLKSKIRETALNLLEMSIGFLDQSSLKSDLTYKIVLNITTLGSMSDIAYSAKFFSEANYKIISNQIHLFVNELSGHLQSDEIKDKELIPASMFTVSYMDTPVSRQEESKIDLSISAESTLNMKKPNASRVSHAMITSHKTPAKTVTSNKTEENGQKNERQQIILNTIRQRGELSIKDLTDVVKGCSEKTIQRELISLVSSGVLLKTGERRWSRYSVSN